MKTQLFIDKSISKHGNTYDYSETVYKKCDEKVKIQCKTHGTFCLTPSAHLYGRGCPECSSILQSIRFKNRTKQAALEFEPKSRVVHLDAYDYSEVVFVGTYTKVKIICKKHGVFEQTPKHHLSGSGCTVCSRSKIGNWLKLYEADKELGSEPGVFYLLKFKHISGFEFLKAGITRTPLKYRYSGKKYNDFTYEIIQEQHLTNLESAQKEKEFINMYKEYKFDFPKDIKFNGYTETFNVDLLDTI